MIQKQANKFRQIEEKNELFSIYIEDIPAWERIRHSVWNRVRNSDKNDVEDIGFRSVLEYTIDLAKGIGTTNPFFSNQSDFVAFGTPRRSLEPDGKWWDLYFDPVYESCNISVVHLENSNPANKYTPKKTKSVKNSNIVKYIGELIKLFNINKPKISDA
ncbi:hypothetical protein, partial [Haloparvum sedimenti]|uniref:hypothetical protein n=1 Tax=Haloparvum sedimenti TaxID=1678448 RepID=UPI001146C046